MQFFSLLRQRFWVGDGPRVDAHRASSAVATHPWAGPHVGGRAPVQPAVVVRFLRQSDLPALLELEHAVWESHQAASAGDMSARISRHPQLAIGAFCPRTGRALASLFAKPAHAEAIKRAGSWQECVSGSASAKREPTSALFGISLSSSSAEAAKAIFGFFWPHALKNGWREMYLGSPVPGLRDWVRDNPGRHAEDYVFSYRNGQPRDPQLRYYYRKGFRKVITVRRDYFPHAASLNYGVILGGKIPLSALSPLWRLLPLSWLQGMKKWLFVLH